MNAGICYSLISPHRPYIWVLWKTAAFIHVNQPSLLPNMPLIIKNYHRPSVVKPHASHWRNLHLSFSTSLKMFISKPECARNFREASVRALTSTMTDMQNRSRQSRNRLTATIRDLPLSRICWSITARQETSTILPITRGNIWIIFTNVFPLFPNASMKQIRGNGSRQHVWRRTGGNTWQTGGRRQPAS